MYYLLYMHHSSIYLKRAPEQRAIYSLISKETVCLGHLDVFHGGGNASTWGRCLIVVIGLFFFAFPSNRNPEQTCAFVSRLGSWVLGWAKYSKPCKQPVVETTASHLQQCWPRWHISPFPCLPLCCKRNLVATALQLLGQNHHKKFI